MYGISKTGFKKDDYYSLADGHFRFFDVTSRSQAPEIANLPTGSYTYVYLPPGSNDQNDFMYVTETTKPTMEYLNSLFGNQMLTLLKNSQNNKFIWLPIIIGNPPDSDTDTQTLTLDSNEIPPDNDGVPTR
jgi:hypothetical protein